MPHWPSVGWDDSESAQLGQPCHRAVAAPLSGRLADGLCSRLVSGWRTNSTSASVPRRPQAVRQVAFIVSRYTVSIQQRRAWTADSCFPRQRRQDYPSGNPRAIRGDRPRLARFRAKIWRSLRAA